MAKLDLEFVGFNDAIDFMTINGELVKLKKAKNKIRTYSLDTEDGKAEIVIYKTHYYTSKNWFWWNLLYYFVSFFGLFDIRQSKKCLVLDSHFTITYEGDTKVVVRRVNFENGGKLVNVETTGQVEELSNVQYHDKEARKKHIKMKKIKTGITIGIAVLVAVLVFVL